jgi:hypothetical protein
MEEAEMFIKAILDGAGRLGPGPLLIEMAC